MPDDTNTPGVFPGDMDNYTPAIIFLKRYVVAAQAELDAAINALDQDYNTAKANIESGTLLMTTTVNAEMSVARAAVRDGYTSSGDALGDVEEPLVWLDKWVVPGGLTYNVNKPDFNSPVYYYPGSWYNNKLQGALANEYVVKCRLAHEFTDDDGVPTQYVGDVCHGLVLERDSQHWRVHTIQDGEIMAIIEDDLFFGNMIIVRQTDGLWARYYQLLNFNRWDYTGEWVPHLKVGDAVHAGDQLGLIDTQVFVDVCYTDALRLDYFNWFDSTIGDVRDNYLELDREGTDDAPAYYKTGTYYGGIDPEVYVLPTEDMVEGSIQTLYVRLNKPITEDVAVALTVVDGEAEILDAAFFAFTPDDWYTAQATRLLAHETNMSYVDDVAHLLFTCHSEGEFNAVSKPLSIVLVNDDIEPEPEGPRKLLFSDFPNVMQEGQTKVFSLVLGAKPTGSVTVFLDSFDPDILDFEWDWQPEGGTPGQLVFTQDDWFNRQALVLRSPFRSISEDTFALLAVVASGGGYSHRNTSEVKVKNFDFYNEEPQPTPEPPITPPITPPTGPVPVAPTSLVGTPDVETCDLAWDVSSDTSITGYEVQVDDDGWVAITGTSSHTVTGLDPATAYVLKLRAVNDNGTGAEASVAVTTDALPVTAADAPDNLELSPGQRHMVIWWDNPVSDPPYTPVDDYEVSYNVVGVSDAEFVAIDEVEKIGALLRYRVINLLPGTAYKFRLRIVDGAAATISGSTLN